ncbi:MAG: hypothetical protein OH335_04990 [Candidatus Parvarchaeota archaeon]|nr:hypothetical protein [Candidatus Jingweiarchaeum tengchongense]
MKMLSSISTDIGIRVDTIRLNRYYSSPFSVDKFGNTKVYIIPKKNATLNESVKRKNRMKEFV